MLKKLEKLENSLNGLIEKLIALWLRFLHWILPQKIFEIKDKTILYFQNKNQQFKDLCIQTFIHLKDKTLEFITIFKEKKEKITSIDLGSKIKDQFLSSKEYLLKTPLKTQVQFLSKCFGPLFKKLGANIQKYSSSQAYIALTALFMIMAGTYGVYHSSQQIYQKEYPFRAPASVQEYDERPEYAMYKRKTVSVFSIRLPITVEKVSDISSVTIDMSVRTSTRWSRHFLESYEYKLKDYFFTTVEPVISDFPLEEEGKLILKEKVRVEVNNFLREHGVEGEVEDVRLLFISAS